MVFLDVEVELEKCSDLHRPASDGARVHTGCTLLIGGLFGQVIAPRPVEGLVAEDVSYGQLLIPASRLRRFITYVLKR